MVLFCHDFSLSSILAASPNFLIIFFCSLHECPWPTVPHGYFFLRMVSTWTAVCQVSLSRSLDLYVCHLCCPIPASPHFWDQQAFFHTLLLLEDSKTWRLLLPGNIRKGCEASVADASHQAYGSHVCPAH